MLTAHKTAVFPMPMPKRRKCSCGMICGWWILPRSIAKIASGITEHDTLRRWQYLASYRNGFHWEANQFHGTGKGW